MTTNLDSRWILGFVDGEGCFNISIVRQKSMKLGFQVLAEFTIVQHERDIQVLHAFSDYFKIGVVSRNHGDRQMYRVRGLSKLNQTIVPFFEKHSLKTKKRVDFIRFRRILIMMSRGQHLTVEGLLLIDKIRQTMNRGPETYLVRQQDGSLELFDHKTSGKRIPRKTKPKQN
jgi:hypothetical protein